MKPRKLYRSPYLVPRPLADQAAQLIREGALEPWTRRTLRDHRGRRWTMERGLNGWRLYRGTYADLPHLYFIRDTHGLWLLRYTIRRRFPRSVQVPKRAKYWSCDKSQSVYHAEPSKLDLDTLYSRARNP